MKDYFKVLINFFKSNPYAAAKLFHGIATDAFRFNPPEEISSFQEETWKSYYGNAEETHTKVSWGTFLP